MTSNTTHELTRYTGEESPPGKPALFENRPDEVEIGSDISDTLDDIIYMQGAKFWLISVAVSIITFLVNLEVPVIITALVSITRDFKEFDNIAWVIASYLLGYVGTIVICAKFSDIFGRKLVFVLAIGIFIIFSAACSAAQTLTQLIIFRAFQGVGGGGSWSLATILVIELVPLETYPKFVTNISLISALALLLGPIIGGAIASNTNWRWIFIINIPIAIPALLITIFVLPKDFPHHNKPGYKRKPMKELVSKSVLNRIDVPGTILILFATLGLTAAFEEADKRFPWRSAYVISLLTVSGLLWIILLVWERYVTLANTVREPILPWRFIVNREMMGVLLNFIFLGGPTVICQFILPQRFQLVYGTSGLDAGVRLIPFSAFIPIGSVVASIIGKKLRVPPVYLLISGSVLQVIGFSLLATLPSTLEIPSRIYGFQIIAGFGCGINFSTLFILLPLVNETRDNAVALGSGSQFRFIGSSIVLSISTSVFNGYVRSRLESQLGISDPDALIQALPTLAPSVQVAIRHVLATGYSRQLIVLAISAALQIPATLMMWKKHQIKL